ncbi:MAG: 50S ribosomal protein L23 [Burkholderiales bacterium]|nr:50S ribosomal protein L23 [Burkholderiales bacterium]
MNKYSKDRLPLVLLAPIVSEKSTMVADKLRQIAFRVADDATKADVKDAVELMFKEQKVEVASVQVLNVKGKQKRFGRFNGRRRNWKKAYVCLKEGSDLNLAEAI